ncbi:Helix-loop-helix DNA-binding protein [Macrophomina phaseolina MS6]|uniref:Helix-loop-helix DNA-binding protein n=1 Tax=Macrophomina phaseolina (strain MS6) TaxID=1126212 RepID=K2QI26_MACPH|nr:Helix-loop-helix DNA-binding protein [Macrophomina phaseolina MS6]
MRLIYPTRSTYVLKNCQYHRDCANGRLRKLSEDTSELSSSTHSSRAGHTSHSHCLSDTSPSKLLASSGEAAASAAATASEVFGTLIPHKVVKRYREGMKSIFRRLCTTVHLNDVGGGGGGGEGRRGQGGRRSDGLFPLPSRLTKAQVIEHTIEYIKQMEKQKESLQSQYERIAEDNSRLRRIMGYLESEVEVQ